MHPDAVRRELSEWSARAARASALQLSALGFPTRQSADLVFLRA